MKPPSPSAFVIAALSALLLSAAGCTKANPDFDDRYAPDSVPMHYDISVDASQSDARVVDGALGDDSTPPPPPLQKPKGVDVLLVIDNSSDMATAQARLSRDIGALLGPLVDLPGGVRVGVVSTDMGTGQFVASACKGSGDAGKLRRGPLCNASGQPYAALAAGAKGTQLTKQASCLMAVGKTGCGFEQPLEALRAALSGGAGAMLRPEAALAIVVLTTEDDCSATSDALFDWDDTSLGPYSDYRCFRQGVLCAGQPPPLSQGKVSSCTPGQTWLHDVKQRYVDFARAQRKWVSVAVIGGPPASSYEIGRRYDKYGYPIYYVEPTCSDGSQIEGRPSVRLDSFAKAFGQSGLFGAVCDASYEPLLGKLAQQIKAAF